MPRRIIPLLVVALITVGLTAVAAPTSADSRAPATAGTSVETASLDPTPGTGPARIDLLQVRSTDAGQSLTYEFTVRGDVQKTRVSERLQAGHNDEVVDNGDGTVTVRGTTANRYGDAYLVVGDVLSIRKTGGGSGMALLQNTLRVTPDQLVNSDALEVISTDSGKRLTYEFTVRGTVERIQTDAKVAGNPNDVVVDNGDGTVTVRGVTGNQFGDAFRIRGDLLDFRKTGGDSDYFTRLDGLEVDLSGSGPSNDGATALDSCTVISSPGRYELTADVTNSTAPVCIEINTSDVVFDGNGHVVDGVDGNESVGVLVRTGRSSVSNVTVRNVTVRDWGDGVRASALDPQSFLSVYGELFENARLQRLTSVSNVREGIRLVEAGEVTIAGSTVRGNGGTGVDLSYFRSNDTIVNSTIADNGGTGVSAFEGGQRLVVRGNVITGNAADGLGIRNDADRARVVDNDVSRNGRAGVVLSISYNDTIANNRITANAVAGIVGSDTSQDVLVGNVVTGGGYGVVLHDASDNTLRGNDVSDNAAVGIVLQRTSDNRLRRNEVRRNGDHGVTLLDADDNVLVQNVVCENGVDPQIFVDGDSTGNALSNNTVVCG